MPCDAVVLALGGASWPRLGSDGAWVPLLEQRGVAVAPLAPANCGFDVRSGWSEYFASRFAGQPFKSVAIRFRRLSPPGRVRRHRHRRRGQPRLRGVRAAARRRSRRAGSATFELDLLPGRSAAQVQAEVAHPRGSRSLASHLKSRLGLDGIKLALLHELLPREDMHDPARLAAAIKALPVTLVARRGRSTRRSARAGGVRFEALDDRPDAARGAGRVLRRRNAGLGSADRRLPAHRLLRHGASRRRGARCDCLGGAG